MDEDEEEVDEDGRVRRVGFVKICRQIWRLQYGEKMYYISYF